MKSMLVIDTPETCGDCPLCIFSEEEKKYIGYCNTSNEDYYCKALERFMEYDRVEGGLDILGKPNDCPLNADVLDKIKAEILDEVEYAYADFEEYKEDILHAESDELPDDDFRYGLERAVEIINKYKAESDKESEE